MLRLLGGMYNNNSNNNNTKQSRRYHNRRSSDANPKWSSPQHIPLHTRNLFYTNGPATLTSNAKKPSSFTTASSCPSSPSNCSSHPTANVYSSCTSCVLDAITTWRQSTTCFRTTKTAR